MGAAADTVLDGTRGVTLAFPDTDGSWRTLIEVLMRPVEIVSTVTIGTADRPAWQIIRDPDLCPVEFLPWLAQHVGVTLPPDADEAEQRARIKDPFGFGECTTEAMKAAVAFTLTGSKAVRVLRHVDDTWWKQTVVTRTAETPNPDATLAAAMAQKPAGVKLTHVITDFALFEDGARTFNATTATFDAATISDVT